MRTNNWPAKLDLFIAEKRHQPFDWRTNNCAFFACDWIAILTEKDHAKGYRSKVTSELTAARRLKEAGGAEAIAEKVCEQNGWQEVTPAFARRGDVVSLDTETGVALGVCAGGVAVFAGRLGVEFRPVTECRKAWRIT